MLHLLKDLAEQFFTWNKFDGGRNIEKSHWYFKPSQASNTGKLSQLISKVSKENSAIFLRPSFD